MLHRTPGRPWHHHHGGANPATIVAVDDKELEQHRGGRRHEARTVAWLAEHIVTHCGTLLPGPAVVIAQAPGDERRRGHGGRGG